MAQMDDQWVRLFNVSDPRRAYAGHTLYKVTSKVFHKDFPEGVTEIAVWRRFSDFKKLHQELLKIYIQKHLKDEEFPAFPKAKYFGRFDEQVIEERRKAALELLTFAGSVPDLFTSQPFVKFFEGGFPESPVRSDSVTSREGSSSDTEGESPRGSSTMKELDTNSGNGVQNDGQSSSLSCTTSRETGDNLEDGSTLGGVWLYKQPSLTEGLDKIDLSSDEEDNDGQTPEGETTTIPQAVTRQSNEEADQNNEEEQDDVFTHDVDGSLENELEISEREDRASSAEPPNWLVRAISICSEGEDLEVLASEADTEELSFPQAFSEYDLSKQEKEKSSCYPRSDSDSSDDVPLDTSGMSAQSSLSVVHGNDENRWTDIDHDKSLDSTNFSEKTESSESSSLKDSSSAGTAEDKRSSPSSSGSGKRVMHQRTISDLANIYIDPKESDYLYAAGHTIHKALDCEVNGKYEEAFSLYKTCVGLLLSGVQGEKDAKRREAVRRKTAQYLLKAEALYNMYLVGNDSPEKSEQDSSPSHASDLCKSDDLQKFKDLTLADLKVMGIIGKVILVENIHNGETFIVKALCKSGATRTHSNSQGSECRRRKSVRRLYGKYPNIVRLYRYFETATSIYLLLEYARGGRLWDHISCYQRNKKSHDYLIRSTNRKYTDLNSASDQTVTSTKTADTANVRPLLQVGERPSEGKDTPDNSTLACRTSNPSTMQDSEHSAAASHAAVLQSDLKENHSGDLAPPLNGNNNKLSEAATVLIKVNKDSAEKCSEMTTEVCPDNKHSLFVKLDEYFSSAAQCVPDEHIRVWAAELVLAVAYLHTSGIICRDLHPKNVLLDEEGHVLLTYFGSWEETDHIPDEAAMNHFYCAPEVWQVDEVTAAADWWSVGALLYEIITGQALSTAHPWGIKTHTELHLPNKISPEAKSLLRELLRVTPSERLGSGVNGVEEIKSHPYFSGVNWTWLCSRIN